MRIGISLTGADEQTPLEGLRHLSNRRGVEVGLLFTATPEGRNRYPSEEWLEAAVAMLGQRAAVHVCGSTARERVLAGTVPWVRAAGRLQINGLVSAQQVERALRIVPHVITQHAPGRPDLGPLSLPGHCLLVDASGGRGRSPSRWERPAAAPGDKPVGFAGGLGPDNLEMELPRIAAVAQGTWWVDMEGKLRDEGDRFDLARAHACVTRFHRWHEGRA